MKKFFVLILSLVLVFGIAGCAVTETPPSGGTPSTGSPETPGQPSGGDEETEQSFTVTLQTANGETLPSLAGVSAIWTDSGSVTSAAFGSDGVAYSNDLDGDYRVTLSRTPDGYTYDPNIYTATNDARSVTILLYPLEVMIGSGIEPSQADRGRISISNSKKYFAYRLTFTTDLKNDTIWFEVIPQVSGYYTMETLIDVTVNEVTPTLKKYPSVYLFAEGKEQETITSGGTSGSYTKNVKYTCKLAPSQSGGSYAFSISVASTNSVYPKYVDLLFIRQGDYSNDDMYDDMNAVYTYEFPPAVISDDFKLPEGTFRFIADYNGKTLDNDMVVYNPADGFYYVDFTPDDGKADYDALLFVALGHKGIVEYGSSGFGPSENGFYDANLKLGRNGKRYELFINGGTYEGVTYTGYAAHAKSGYYPATNELKDFLYNFSVSKTVFYDGLGSAESAGYSAGEDDQWLFACGFFA